MGSSDTSPVDVAVIGLGTVAQAVHLPLLAKHPERFRIAALCDLSPGHVAALGATYGVPPERRFTDADQLLASGGIDAVAILSSGSHGALAAAAAQAGIAVFCEKPLAFTLAELDDLASADPMLLLGYMKLYDPAVERAASVLRERTDPRSIEVTVLHPPAGPQLAHAALLPPARDVAPDAVGQLTAEEDALLGQALGAAPVWLRRLYTDVLLGSIVHELAVIRMLAGGPLEIEDVDVWPVDDTGSVALTGRLERGARVSIRWHYLERYPAYREEVRVHDEHGSVELVFASPYLLNAPTVLTVSEPDHEADRVVSTRSTAEAFERQWLAFERLVREGTPPRAAIEEAREDAVVCQAAARIAAARHDIEIGGEAASAQRPQPVG